MTTVIVQNVLDEIREPDTNIHKCGFCREYGHNISQCNNGRIVEIDNKLNSLLDICKREQNDIRLYNCVKLLKIKELRVLLYLKEIRCSSKFTKNRYVALIMLLYYYNAEMFPEGYTAEFVDIQKYWYDVGIAGLSHTDAFNTYMINTRSRKSVRKFEIEPTMSCLDDMNEYECADCPICMNDNIKPTNIISTNCNHTFCGNCMKTYLDTIRKNVECSPSCALCRSSITSLQINDVDLFKDFTENYCL